MRAYPLKDASDRVIEAPTPTGGTVSGLGHEQIRGRDWPREYNAESDPGSVVGSDCLLYPGSQWRGYVDSGKIVKVTLRQKVVDR